MAKKKKKKETVTESRRQDRQEQIHSRKGGTHRSIAGECGALNTALPARRRMQNMREEGG